MGDKRAAKRPAGESLLRRGWGDRGLRGGRRLGGALHPAPEEEEEREEEAPTASSSAGGRRGRERRAAHRSASAGSARLEREHALRPRDRLEDAPLRRRADEVAAFDRTLDVDPSEGVVAEARIEATEVLER
jgi:hypothetical protein